MKNKRIIFTEKYKAQLLDVEYILPSSNQVVVETAFSTISCGTEKASISGMSNTTTGSIFPKTHEGYSSAGTVVAIGDSVESVKAGDRVVVYGGTHGKYNTINESNVIKIEDDSISFKEAALSYICIFSLAAVRKVRLEIGESAIVMGLGILGQLAVKLLRAAGATPIIAVDPIESRRNEAILCGADYAFDPCEKDFAEKVKNITNGGAYTAIEVSGVGAGLDGVLDCMAKFGRVALLGCTRDKNFTIDYYQKIHLPGITIVGAHTMARPEHESYHGYYTTRDDIKTVLNLCASKRIQLEDLIKEIHNPEDCGEVYRRLVNDKDFPVVVQFDWSEVL